MFTVFSDCYEWFNQNSLAKEALSLDILLAWAKELDILPHAPVITITGTNGKGSAASVLTHLLTYKNYKVASFTSPHLTSWTERITINNTPVTEQEMIDAFIFLKNKIPILKLKFFQILFFIALFLFKKQNLDFIILEVGIGGKHDITNIIDATLVILTQVGLDHTELLGETREKIGFEKAGLLRPEIFFVCGDDDPPQSVLQEVNKHACQSFWQNKDFFYREYLSAWDINFPFCQFDNLPLPLLNHKNIASALMAGMCLDVFPDDYFLKNILPHISLAGRIEQHIFAERKIILDVAHNPSAIEHLIFNIKKVISQKQKIFILFGAMKDKNIVSMLSLLQEIAYQWYFTDLNLERAASADMIGEIYQNLSNKKNNFSVFQNPHFAWEAILSESSKNDVILICGSFHTVYAIHSLLKLNN